jgi:hypothetical protein
MSRAKGVFCIALASLSTASVAHHSFSMFDMQKNITLEGTIKELQWANPHIWIQILVKDENGKEVEWSIEGGSPNMLSRYGWNRHSLKPGDKAVAVINPRKKPGPDARIKGGGLRSITVNGERIFAVRNLDPAATDTR